MFRYLPEQASDFAHRVDWLNNLITDLSVFFTVIIFGTAIYFAIKYRRKQDQPSNTPRIEGDHRLEIIWTVVPTIICIFIAYEGLDIYKALRSPPANTLDIQVWGRSWGWDFEYANGKKTTDEFTVPVDKPIRLVMKSRDVLHSFFIPAMRVKNDVIPNKFTQLWFRPVKTGQFNVFCTEYCGDKHSAMLAKLNVVSQAEYERWYNDDSEAYLASKFSPADKGFKVYKTYCQTCHSLDGSRVIGPTWKGLWGTERVFEDGSKAAVDENYITESILYPAKQIVQGYPNAMVTYEGILSDDDITHVIAFLKEVDSYAEKAKAEAQQVEEESQADDSPQDTASLTPVEKGAKLYTELGCNACHSVDGTRLVGPSLKGLWQRKGKFTDGTEYVADAEYIRSSILQPAAQIVEGYPNGMLPYEGRIDDQQIVDITEYIKSLS